MATILALSSLVARGHVGLSAMTPALQRLGHEVVGLPTVLLSNHPGHRHVEAMPVPPGKLAEMLSALDDNGWLGETDAVITGYLPSAAHVDFACALIGKVRARRPDALILCDPVIGDWPKGLYIEEEAAAAIRADLLPLARFATPNAFELAWLSGKRVQDVQAAAVAARALPVPSILVTSVPADAGRLANVLVAPDKAFKCTVQAEQRVPHGTGDFLAAILAAQCLYGAGLEWQLGISVAATAALIAASRGRDELNIVSRSAAWDAAPPCAVEALYEQSVANRGTSASICGYPGAAYGSMDVL